QLDALCYRFDVAWKAGQRPRIEDYLGEMPPAEIAKLLRELLALEMVYRSRSGETLVLDDYQQRFPDHAELIQRVFCEEVTPAAGRPEGADSSGPAASTGPDLGEAVPAELPEYLGRYRITAKL